MVSGHNPKGAIMATAKVDTNNEYLNTSPEDFSEIVQAALKEERAIYDMLKEAKAKVLAAVKAELPMPNGREVKRTAYTAWGQWQVIVGDTIAPKSAPGQRRSLADFIAEQQAAGRRA